MGQLTWGKADWAGGIGRSGPVDRERDLDEGRKTTVVSQLTGIRLFGEPVDLAVIDGPVDSGEALGDRGGERGRAS
jgi:hypothetical protein